MNSIIDADTERARSGIQARAEETRKKFRPLRYDDIKDDPYYNHIPEPEVDDA